MVQVRTDLGTLRESARRLRVEEDDGIDATTVQGALENNTTSISALNTSVSTINATISTLTGNVFNQRSITGSGNLPLQSTDVVLNVNVVTALTVTVLDYQTRSGVPLRFEDVGGTWGTNNITFNRTGTNTFDGATSVVASINYGWIEFTPMNDGVNAGYKLKGIYR